MKPPVAETKPSPKVEEPPLQPEGLSGAPAMWELAQSLGLNPEILTYKEYFPNQFIFGKWSELLERELTEEEKPIFQLLMDEVRRRGING